MWLANIVLNLYTYSHFNRMVGKWWENECLYNSVLRWCRVLLKFGSKVILIMRKYSLTKSPSKMQQTLGDLVCNCNMQGKCKKKSNICCEKGLRLYFFVISYLAIYAMVFRSCKYTLQINAPAIAICQWIRQYHESCIRHHFQSTIFWLYIGNCRKIQI